MKKDRKQLGKYDWSGECDPAHTTRATNAWAMFSVGIFQWVQGKGKLKKGKVVLRIKGDTTNPEAVYKTAENYCDRLDNIERPKFKTLNMGGV